MKYTFYTSGTCSSQIDFEVEDNVIKQVFFTGGCHGNLQGISRLVQGMTCDEAIAKLEVLDADTKQPHAPTSLPERLKKQWLGNYICCIRLNFFHNFCSCFIIIVQEHFFEKYAA